MGFWGRLGPEPIVSRCQAPSPRIKILKVWVADFRAGTHPQYGGVSFTNYEVFQAARPPNPRIKKGLEKEMEPGGQNFLQKNLVVYYLKMELVPKVKRSKSKLQDLRSGIFMPPCRRTPD